MATPKKRTINVTLTIECTTYGPFNKETREDLADLFISEVSELEPDQLVKRLEFEELKGSK